MCLSITFQRRQPKSSLLRCAATYCYQKPQHTRKTRRNTCIVGCDGVFSYVPDTVLEATFPRRVVRLDCCQKMSRERGVLLQPRGTRHGDKTSNIKRTCPQTYINTWLRLSYGEKIGGLVNEPNRTSVRTTAWGADTQLILCASN